VWVWDLHGTRSPSLFIHARAKTIALKAIRAHVTGAVTVRQNAIRRKIAPWAAHASAPRRLTSSAAAVLPSARAARTAKAVHAGSPRPCRADRRSRTER